MPAAKDPDNSRLARSAARLAAVQALFQIEATNADWRVVVREFDEHRLGAEIEGAQYREADHEHFHRTVNDVIEHQSEIDRLTNDSLEKKWPLERIDPTLRALFRAASAELLYQPNIPRKVVLGEYVDIAHAFFPDAKEAGFVNAVLDHIVRNLPERNID